jgi:DNA polymerase III delta subunit
MEAADKIRKAARTQGFSEREVLTVERSFKWGALLAANQSQSLFGDKKLIDYVFRPVSRARTARRPAGICFPFVTG